MICALGYNLYEATCPRAPCVECMGKLGAGIARDLKVLGRQRACATDRGEHEASAKLEAIAQSLDALLTSREGTPPQGQGPITRTGYSDPHGQDDNRVQPAAHH